jgi:hypothetical protein
VYRVFCLCSSAHPISKDFEQHETIDRVNRGHGCGRWRHREPIGLLLDPYPVQSYAHLRPRPRAFDYAGFVNHQSTCPVRHCSGVRARIPIQTPRVTCTCNVSRRYVVSLLEVGEILFRKSGQALSASLRCAALQTSGRRESICGGTRTYGTVGGARVVRVKAKGCRGDRPSRLSAFAKSKCL